MSQFKIIQIKSLMNIDLTHLVKESKEDGFRFLERLVHEYECGINKFDKPGESLYGLFNKEGGLIAIGGMNKDPYTTEDRVGRLRRFYVSKNNRRKGLGRLLLKKIMYEAKKFYNVLVLHTDTEQGNYFYTSIGFVPEEIYPNTTHYFYL